MTKYDFNNILDRRWNGSMKWEKPYIKKRFQLDVDEKDELFPMFIADMDFKLPEEILKPMHERYAVPDFGYFHVQDSFYESIMEWYKDVHQIDLKKEWIVPSCGTVASMHIATDLLARGKNILMMTPVYGPFKSCCHFGTMFTCPLLLNENRYEIDFDEMESLFKEKDMEVLLMCNPHNPGGRSWTREELSRLVGLCKEYGVTILSDEIHSDLQISNQKFTSLIEFQDVYDRILVSTSPNKTFSISGLATSYVLCANAQIKEQYEGYMSGLHLGQNRVGIEMTEIVYRNGKAWRNELEQVIRKNVEMVSATMKRLDVTMMEPDAGFLVWIRVKDTIDVDAFIVDLAKEHHVLLETGSRFVENYKGWIRINVGTSPVLVQKAMSRFEKFYREYE